MIICHIYFRKLDLNKRLQTQRFYLKYFLCSQCDFYLINYKHTHTHKKTQNLYFIVLYSIIIFISAMIFMQMHTYIYTEYINISYHCKNLYTFVRFKMSFLSIFLMIYMYDDSLHFQF